MSKHHSELLVTWYPDKLRLLRLRQEELLKAEFYYWHSAIRENKICMVSDDFSRKASSLMLQGTQTHIEATLYRRPNLRLTARPGRVQGGEEDRYQPLSQPPPLDTTRYIDSLSLNTESTHTPDQNQFYILDFIFSLSLSKSDTHATSLPCSGGFLWCPGSSRHSSQSASHSLL